MARELKAKVKLEGDTSGADKALGGTESRLQRLTSFISGKVLVALAAVAAAFYAMGRALESVISSATKQQDAVKKLDASLVSLGDKAKAVSASLQAYAAELQKVTRAGDEEIIKGQALLATFTKHEAEIKAATLAALNLSAAMGVDLNAAFLLLGKAAAGETTTLSRYGIILDDNVPKSEKFAAVIEKINTQFGGQAQAEAKTYSGLLEQLGNVWGDIKEKLGDAVIKNEAVLASFTKLKNALTGEGVASAVKALAGGLATLATEAARAGSVLIDFVGKVADFDRGIAASKAAGGAFAALLEKIGSGFELIGKAIGLVIAPVRYAASAFTELGRVQRETTDATVENIKAQYEIAKRLYAQEDAAKKAAEAAAKYGLSAEQTAKLIDAWATAEERLKRILGEEEDALQTATEIAKEYGVTLGVQVTEELKKQAAQLEALREAERRGIATREEVVAIQQKMKQTIAELRGETTDAVTPTNQLNAAIGDTAKQTRDATDALGKIQTVLADTKKLVVTTAIAFDQLAESAGRASAIQAALAGGAEVTQGGTRLRFPGGAGSRLLLGDEGLFPGISGTTGVFSVPAGTSYQVLPDGRVIYF